MKTEWTILQFEFRALIVGLVAILWSIRALAFEPQLRDCTLQIGTNVLKPVEVDDTWRDGHRIGTARFYVFKDTVEYSDLARSNFSWRAHSDDGRYLELLTADRQIAYFAGYNTNKDGGFQGYESNPRIRRLELGSGKWLPDLPIGTATPSGFKCTSVIDALTNEDGITVLLGLKQLGTQKSDERTIDLYSLARFKTGADVPLWKAQYAGGNARPYTGGYLWGIPGPAYADSGLHPLTCVGEHLLVCPEAMQPVYCLDPDTGLELWRLERLWEFQRGFIGPSVWSHYISRFGIDDDMPGAKDLPAVRKSFETNYQCALSGGPAAVPLDFLRDGDSHSIFITAVKGPAREWAGYLSDSLLYELGDDGKVISILTLPQVAEGSEYCIRDGGVIWKCQNSTFIKISPCRDRPQISMGGGNADGIGNLAWARRIEYQAPEAWFVSAKAADPVAYGDHFAYCLPGGGYVSQKSDKVYRFPLAAVDLSSGRDFQWSLNVPFNGTFDLPTENMSQTSSDDGPVSTRSLTAYLLSIRQLVADGDKLQIAITSETRSQILTFDLTSVLDSLTILPHQTAADSMMRAIERAKLVKPSALNETLAKAAKDDSDPVFLKALIKEGADPKYSSPLGWTALMTAACYGTAQKVDLLIKAGSNVNAADKNCGGQSILMWAAGSRRDSKPKVHSLLKAGANLKQTAQGGYNALMSAAGEGNLETVELLLNAGMSIAARSDSGETALMIGARSGGAKVVALLLSAGADPSAKNDQGQTALEIAKASHHPDSDEVVAVLSRAVK